MTKTLPRHSRTVTGDDVILITHADCDSGYELARELVASGRRVVVTARYVTSLTRILLGKSSSHVMAIAADIDDHDQRVRLMQRAADSFGRIDWVVDGRSGELTHNISSDAPAPSDIDAA